MFNLKKFFFVYLLCNFGGIRTTKGFEACDPYWTNHNQRCYKVFQENGYNNFNWTDANQRCQSENAQLLNINATKTDGYDEFKFLEDFALLPSNTPFWIGLQMEPTTYSWPDNSKYVDGFDKTSKGDCFVLEWNRLQVAEECYTPHGYACKKPQDPTNKTCEAKWKSFRNSCYFFGRKAVTWEGAEKRCRKRGANLTGVADRSESYFLQGNRNLYSVWTGLRRDPPVLKWTDNSTINEWSFESLVYSWYSRRVCAYLTRHDFWDKGLHWKYQNCGYHEAFICEKPVENINMEILQVSGVLLSLVIFCVTLIIFKRRSLKNNSKAVPYIVELDETFDIMP